MSNIKGLQYKELRAYSIATNPGKAIIFNNENFDKSKNGTTLLKIKRLIVVSWEIF